MTDKSDEEKAIARVEVVSDKEFFAPRTIMVKGHTETRRVNIVRDESNRGARLARGPNTEYTVLKFLRKGYDHTEGGLIRAIKREDENDSSKEIWHIPNGWTRCVVASILDITFDYEDFQPEDLGFRA
jgi:hypothetical protein